MAYIQNTWQTGDIITAERLNHMEAGISEGGNVGYEITAVTVFDGEITTTKQDGYVDAVAFFETTNPLNAEKIVVIINGQQYEWQKQTYYGANTYGIEDADTKPLFLIESYGDANTFYAETAGTYSVKISVPTVVATPEFDMAVKAVASPYDQVLVVTVTPAEGTDGLDLDKTWQEIHDAAIAVCKWSEGTSIGTYIVQSTYHEENAYGIKFTKDDVLYVFEAEDANGWPHHVPAGE